MYLLAVLKFPNATLLKYMRCGVFIWWAEYLMKQHQFPTRCGTFCCTIPTQKSFKANTCSQYSGADPGFWERGGPINIFTTGGGGVSPPVTARGSGGALIAPPVGSGGALIAPPVGSGASPQPLFAFAFISTA